jgi:gliding motility-associated-like protein
VTSPIGGGGVVPTDLYISEVTDADTGSLTYIEIYNGTGNTVDLANYKLKIYNFGTNLSNPVTLSCDLGLSGIITNNATSVIKVSSNANQVGVSPDLTFTACGGVNNNDYIKLTSNSDVDIDLWGRTDGTIYTPSNQPGYTYRRLNTAATVPSTTWIETDWTALDPEDYTNVGSYTALSTIYQYSLDNGTYQTSTTFTGITPGNHTITVQNTATGCFSLPFAVTIDAVPQFPSVTTFSYATPVCQNAVTNPTPDTSATGFTAGGTYTSTTGLAINGSTGEIDLATTTPGTYDITYAVLYNVATCQSAGSTVFTIVINPIVTPVTTFTYTTPVCQNGTNPTPDTSATGFTSGGSYTSTTGLSIDATTGTINLAASTAGTYTVTYAVTANAATCLVAGSTSFVITISPVVTPVTTFSYTTPVCAGGTNPLPDTSAAGFTSGGTYTSTSGLVLNSTTGEIDLALSSSGTYTVTYSVNADVLTCQSAQSSPAVIVISSPVEVSVVGDCEGVNYVIVASPIDGSFDPSAVTYSWEDSTGLTIGGNTQSIVVTNPETYTVTVVSNGCSGSAFLIADEITCKIQKGISPNGDDKNDFFDLAGLNVKNLGIFNRYGAKVYSKSNYTNQWVGQSDKGDELPDGTYYFVIERDNGETKTGWIYINREI